MGCRLPFVRALETSLRSGVWVAIVDRDAVVSAPGASRGGAAKSVGPGGVGLEEYAVMEGTSALRATFMWHFVACSEVAGALDRLDESAMRYTESYASDHSFVRIASRLARRRPRAPVSAEDPAWLQRALRGCCVVAGTAWFIRSRRRALRGCCARRFRDSSRRTTWRPNRTGC